MNNPILGQPLICPLGATECSIIDELAGLRTEMRELRAQSQRDELTGLYNFRFFRNALEQEMERSRRSLLPTVLIMLDLDHFKQVNDRYGHEAGNLVLKQTAEHIQRHLRKLDLGCRYGGEEFAIILPNTQLNQALEAAERLRALRESEPALLADGTRLKVTASFGLAIFRGTEALSREAFVELADQELYRAKAEGRNRVCAARPAKSIATEVTMDEKRALLE
jgi:diguanylate cyclase (GGDEF)-like protein